ncbi:MAG TPA: ATP-binding protein [Egicoccus sp.]|nr:ATP-binding protein [Egicoccus sp.]HSK24286.1 ATP-binding protein [Egicoccus sp.]
MTHHSGRRTWTPSRRRVLVGATVGALGPLLVAAVLIGVQGQVDGATVGLAMLVPTTVAAALGGPATAVLAVVVGSVTHNLLFTVPYLTLRMTDPTEALGLVVHTVVAATVSFVVVREQRAAALAAQRSGAAERVALLEDVDRVRTALLGAVSHDLRTPLAAIAAAASDLQDAEVSLAPAHRRMLATTISERTQALDRMVEQLLDASRLQAGAVHLLVEAVEVQDLVAEAGLLVAGGPSERIRLRAESTLPPVLVDPVLIVTALRNLLDNALRHAPSPTEVVVDAATAGEVVVIAVSDEGPGVRDDDADVFEPFQGGSDGPGLGLTIARGFIELHGGRLDHHERPGGGAVFEFTLPSVDEPEA